MTEEMNIHKGLCEIKTLTDRIESKIEEASFITAIKSSDGKVKGTKADDWKKNEKALLDSIRTLINRKKAIKRAINQSNAQTKITVAGVEYTVAEAIYMKNEGIAEEQELVQKLKDNYKAAVDLMTRKNEEADRRSEEFAKSASGNKDKDQSNSAEIEKVRKSFYDSQVYEIVDAVNTLETIKQLEEEIDAFTSEIDSALSVSNATTLIQIEY